ncbi:MAG: undecaprenyl/decaprenyl-phosphate alpha-N-acetylglucosaminyl 1-phosphate transferase [Cyclobacteriaceae bacterium]
MERAILSFVTAFAISYLIFPPAIKAFYNFGLVDNPGGRKIHTSETPALGGIPIFLGVILSLSVWLPIGMIANYKFFIVAIVFIFILGLRDDLSPVKAIQKLIGQIAAASLLFFLCDIRIESFYGLFGLYQMPLWLSYFATVFTIIVITNAYNLIDGIDGLAGSVGLITLLFLGTWFLITGEEHFSFIGLAFAGAILAFLIYNWSPSKIFMGDSGSSIIGLLIAFYTIYFISSNAHLPSSATLKFKANIGTPVGLLIIPLLDTFRIFIKRTFAGKSFMKPDNNHIHHVLLSLGNDHKQATIILISIKLAFLILVFSLRKYPDMVVLPIVVGSAILFSVILNLAYKRHQSKQGGNKGDKPNQVFINKVG